MPSLITPQPAPDSLEQLEELLSRPTPATRQTLAQLPGDILIVGVAGKMGPSLARMARRACPNPARRIIGLSRFSSPGATMCLGLSHERAPELAILPATAAELGARSRSPESEPAQLT